MFRPNDVGYTTVIDAYSRSRDGPNAERVLGTMKRRGVGEEVDDDEHIIRNISKVSPDLSANK